MRMRPRWCHADTDQFLKKHEARDDRQRETADVVDYLHLMNGVGEALGDLVEAAFAFLITFSFS